ncbi:MAG: hypothetical protein HUU21_25155 [Polyangiaceae bacterium]|nr:hypothetical protein [Polyangiaceae bacterium]
MPWYHNIAYFFGGVFLANCLPHFLAGVSGKPFPTPFASPPFKGLSSSAVNVAWGLLNMAIAYLLLVQVGEFDIKSYRNVGISFAGLALMAFQLARSLGRIHSAPP